jgi:hypothetical protein
MKKIITLGLICFLCGMAFVSAEDAKIMPKRVGRLYMAPSFGFANGEYDKDGKYESYDSGEGAMKLFNLGFALEYGVIDWVTAAVQWAPGVNVWSDVDRDLGSDSDVNANGVADLFAGAKLQIIGEKAPVQSGMFRLAFGPGFKIPLPGPDYEEQSKNIAKDDPVTAANVDRHVFGLGLRTYFDYIINEHFFINFYNEIIGYPVKGKLSESGLEGRLVVNGLDTLKKQLKSAPLPALVALADEISYEDEVEYGYDLTFELEPVFSTPLGGGIVFTAGLPLNYKMTPGKKYNISDLDGVKNTLAGNPLTSQYASMVGQLQEQTEEKPTGLFTIKPNVSFFFTGWFLPTDFKLQYSIPVAGKNDRALNTLSLIVKLYLRI